MYRILPAISSPSPIFPQFPALAYFSSPCPRVPRLLKRRASARLQRSEATPEGTSPRIRSTPHPRASRLRNNVACASTHSEERSDPSEAANDYFFESEKSLKKSESPLDFPLTGCKLLFGIGPRNTALSPGICHQYGNAENIS